MLTTLLRPSDGTVSLNVHDVVDDPTGARREFGRGRLREDLLVTFSRIEA